MYRRILLAFDGSQSGHEALHQGAELARLYGAQVMLVCPRRSNFDPPCRLNFDPGLVAGSW